MIAYRIKHKNIISELYLPEEHNGKTVIFLSGLPSFLGKNEITRQLINSGVTIFQPFYSGSFDSGGIFSPQQCIKDVKEFIVMAEKNKYTELYYNRQIFTKTREIILIGTSFGSSIATLSCHLPKISKVILLSPVLTYDQKTVNGLGVDFDFKKQMLALVNLLRNGYPYTYRIKNWVELKKFLTGKDPKMDPINHLAKHSKKATLVIHGQKDTSVPSELSKILLTKNKAIKSLNFLAPENTSHGISTYEPTVIESLIKFITK